MRRSTHLPIAITAGAIALALEVVFGVETLGGWTAVPEFLKALVVMSLVGIAIAGIGIAAGFAGAVAVTLVVYVGLDLISDEPKNRTRGPMLALSLLLVLLLIPCIAVFSSQSKGKERERKLEEEKASAAAFVETHPDVVVAAGAPVHAWIFSMSYEDKISHMPTRYEVGARGATEVYTAVYPDRTKVPIGFAIRCVSRKAPTERKQRADECRP